MFNGKVGHVKKERKKTDSGKRESQKLADK